MTQFNFIDRPILRVTFLGMVWVGHTRAATGPSLATSLLRLPDLDVAAAIRSGKKSAHVAGAAFGWIATPQGLDW